MPASKQNASEGDSGGPVLDLLGNVIGVISSGKNISMPVPIPNPNFPTTHATALSNGNEVWLNDHITNYCKSGLMIYISNATENSDGTGHREDDSAGQIVGMGPAPLNKEYNRCARGETKCSAVSMLPLTRHRHPLYESVGALFI